MDDGTEIREAVRIIIERFRAHPEEFGDEYGSKFGWVFGSTIRLKSEDFTDVLNEAEKAALDEIHKEHRYRLFHARVMQSLLGDVQYEAKGEVQRGLTAVPGGGWVNPQSIYATANNINQAQLTHSFATAAMQVQGNSLKPTK